MEKKTYSVKVIGGFSPYIVKCYGKNHLDKYLKALKGIWPYFRLLSVDSKSPTKRQPNCQLK